MYFHCVTSLPCRPFSVLTACRSECSRIARQRLSTTPRPFPLTGWTVGSPPQ
jgi:hypothetical protein